jgi:hypothetical protein
MLPKATSAFKTSQIEAEDSASDRDDTFEERIIALEKRITAFETIVQSTNLKFD